MQKKSSNRYTISFVIIVCLVCATLLSIVSISLRKPQEEAEELYNSQQLLIAARLLSHEGYFTARVDGTFVRAQLSDGKLVPDPEAARASSRDILDLYTSRVKPMLANADGNLITFSEAGLDEAAYIAEHKRGGYAHLDEKLVYVIDNGKGSLYGYVIPINGFGLWDAIYGYICLEPDANHIIGTAWYDQKETPGLGAEIATADWQDQFTGKQIFMPGPNGTVNFATTPIGIDVAKGNAKNLNEVDGIAGATVTSNGVTEAYRQSLEPYRAFLIKAHQSYKEQDGR